MERFCEYRCGTMEHLLIVCHIQKIHAQFNEGVYRFRICFILKRVESSTEHSDMACAGNSFFLVFVGTSLRPAFQVINQMVQLLFAYLGQMRCMDSFMLFIIAVPPCSNAHEINGIEIMVVQNSLIHITISGHNCAHQFVTAIVYIGRQFRCGFEFF